MTVKSRLTMYAETQYGNVSKFEKACNLSNGYVNSMRTSVGEKALEKILEHNPKLNKIWLLMGEGQMFLNPKKTQIDDTTKENAVSIKKVLPEILGEIEEKIIMLQSYAEIHEYAIAEIQANGGDALEKLSLLRNEVRKVASRRFHELQTKLFCFLIFAHF